MWVTLDPTMPRVRDMLTGIRVAARERPGVVLRLVSPGAGDAAQRSGGPDGLIGWFGATPPRPAVSVFSVGGLPEACRVFSDPAGGAALEVAHLLERDFKTIRTFRSGPLAGVRKERVEKAEALAREAGCDTARYQRAEPLAGLADERETDEIVAWLLEQPLPLGVLAADDWHGLRVIEAAVAAGLRVPDEVAVIGYHNDEPLCNFCDPPLSSVATDQEGIGRRAMEMLLRMLDGQPAEGPIRVPPLRVVARGSTDVQHTADPLVGAALCYIRDQLAGGITPADVERHVPASPRTLRRRFLEHRGQTVAEALRTARLDRVARLLLLDDAPLVAVAVDAGYAHVSQMCRDFKRHTGRTPTEHRQEHRPLR